MRQGLSLLSCAIGLLTACSSNPSPTAKVSVAVGALSLPGLEDACYTLRVENGDDEVVWQRSGICSSRFGDGVGSISFVGPCDASQGAEDNRVTLVLESLFDAGGEVARDSYQNPCGDDTIASSDPAYNFDGFGPCRRTFTCEPNADIPVAFDLTIMRDARQGFFDVAVNFEDIFCSAKVDCNEANGEPIALLHNPATDTRDATAIAALACYAGDASTALHMEDVRIVCGATTYIIDPSAGPGLIELDAGNDPILFAAAVYEGVTAQAGAGLSYWNVALGIDESALPSSGCVLEVRGTASEGSWAASAGYIPSNFTTYPVLAANVPLSIVDGKLQCGQHPINAVGSEYRTIYAPTGRFSPHLFCHELVPGALELTSTLPDCGVTNIFIGAQGGEAALQIDGAVYSAIAPPNAFVDANDDVVTGPISMIVLPDGFDGSHGVSGGGDPVAAGYIANFTFIDELGNEVQVAPGALVTIRLPLPSDSLYLAGEPIDFYTYDSANDVWILEATGAVIEVGGVLYAEASVSHFSWYGVQPSKKACVDVTLVDPSGNPIVGQLVRSVIIPASGAYFAAPTDTDGQVCLQTRAQGYRASIQIPNLAAGTIVTPALPYTTTPFANVAACGGACLPLTFVVELPSSCDGDYAAGEECDGGALCASDCTCEDGAVPVGDGACTMCGNGSVDLGEVCDPLFGNGDACRADTCECELGFVAQNDECVPELDGLCGDVDDPDCDGVCASGEEGSTDCDGLCVTGEEGTDDCNGLCASGEEGSVDCDGLCTTDEHGTSDCDTVCVLGEEGTDDCDGLCTTAEHGTADCDGSCALGEEGTDDCDALCAPGEEGTIDCDNTCAIGEEGTDDCDGVCSSSWAESGSSDCDGVCANIESGSPDCNGICANGEAGTDDCDGLCTTAEHGTSDCDDLCAIGEEGTDDCDGLCASGESGTADCDGFCAVGEQDSSDCDGVCGVNEDTSTDCDGVCAGGEEGSVDCDGRCTVAEHNTADCDNSCALGEEGTDDCDGVCTNNEVGTVDCDGLCSSAEPGTPDCNEVCALGEEGSSDCNGLCQDGESGTADCNGVCAIGEQFTDDCDGVCTTAEHGSSDCDSICALGEQNTDDCDGLCASGEDGSTDCDGFCDMGDSASDCNGFCEAGDTLGSSDCDGTCSPSDHGSVDCDGVCAATGTEGGSEDCDGRCTVVEHGSPDCNGLCEAGEVGTQDCNGTCTTGEEGTDDCDGRCLAAEYGSGDCDGVCHPGETFYLECNGICEAGEAGSNDCDGVCWPVEDALGDSPDCTGPCSPGPSGLCDGVCDPGDAAQSEGGPDCDGVCQPGESGSTDCNNTCDSAAEAGSTDCDGSCFDLEGPPDCDGHCNIADHPHSQDCSGGGCAIGDEAGSVRCNGLCEFNDVAGSADCNGICNVDEANSPDCDGLCEVGDTAVMDGGDCDESCQVGEAGSADCNGFCDRFDSASGTDCDGVCDPNDHAESPDCDGRCDSDELAQSPDCNGLCGPGETASSPDCNGLCDDFDEGGSVDCDGSCAEGETSPDCNGLCEAFDQSGPDCNNNCDPGEEPSSPDCDGLCNGLEGNDSPDCDGWCVSGENPIDCNGVCDHLMETGSSDCNGVCDSTEEGSFADCDGACGPGEVLSDDCNEECEPGDDELGPDCLRVIDEDLGGTAIAETAVGIFSVSADSNAFVDSQGQPVTGEIVLRVVPGFSGNFALSGGGELAPEVVADIHFTLTNGEPVSVASGQTVQLVMPLPATTTYQVGDNLNVYYFDELTETWGVEAVGTVVAHGDGLGVSVTVEHFSSWAIGGSPGSLFSRVSGSEQWGSLCFLTPTGEVECPALRTEGIHLAPQGGGFVSLAVAETHGCALHGHGTIVCWGNDTEGQASAPNHADFIQVATADFITCGLRQGGFIVCWGDNSTGQITGAPSGGGYQEVAVGAGMACALDAAGAVHCWGVFDPALVLGGHGFSQLSIDAFASMLCAISEGVVTCAGPNAFEIPVDELVGAVAARELRMGYFNATVLYEDGTVGYAASPWQWGLEASAPTVGGFVGIGNVGCAVRADGTSACWTHGYWQGTLRRGDGNGFETVLPDRVVLRANGSVESWNPAWHGPSPAGTGYKTVMSDGGGHLCAIDSDDRIVCWGESANAAPLGGPSGTFIALAAASGAFQNVAPNPYYRGRFCAIATGGAIHCWGNALPQSPAHPTTGQWTAIWGHHDGFCAKRSDGTFACWGANANDRKPPANLQANVVALSENCALLNDQSIECWAFGPSGNPTPSAPPGNDFIDIAKGAANGWCALRQSGELSCWGLQQDYNRPWGSGFVALFGSTRWGLCGVRTDGTASCGGPNPGDGLELHP